MTDAEAEEIRRRAADETTPSTTLRADLLQLLEDRDARRDLERDRKS